MPPLLTIASVIKPPSPGFDKTLASVKREFAGADDFEFLIKIKSTPPKQSLSGSLSGSGLGPQQSSAATCGLPFAAKVGLRPDSDPDPDSDYLRDFGRIIESPDSGVFDGMNQALAAFSSEMCFRFISNGNSILFQLVTGVNSSIPKGRIPAQAANVSRRDAEHAERSESYRGPTLIAT